MIATGAALISYVPVGILSARFGRKRMIQIGVVLLTLCFVVLGGVLVFVSGVLLLMSWPGSGFWVIGLFISAELIFAGWTSIIVALAARRAAHNQPPHPDHEAGTPAGLAG